MTFKELNGSKKIVISTSIAVIIGVVVFIFTIGGKYRIAEQGIGKVPTIEVQVGDHEKRITKLETTVDLKFKSIDEKLDILIKGRTRGERNQ